MHQMKLDNNVFFTTKKHKMTRKNFMESTTHARSQSSFHDFFSCHFVPFVVQKELFFTLHFSHSGWRD